MLLKRKADLEKAAVRIRRLPNVVKLMLYASPIAAISQNP